MTLSTQIEALLFASDQPLPKSRLGELLPGATRDEIQAALDELEAQYADGPRAFRLLRVGGGLQLATKPELSDIVRRLFTTKRRVRLTKAALESLAIIAYKQPTTRPEIDAIRGVASGGVIETLLERNLVRLAGRAEGVGRPLLYATTPEFLQYLGLNSIDDLPSLGELEAMLAERESAARLADEEEMLALEDAARQGLAPEDGAETPAPAARLEDRLRERNLPTLEELDSELRERADRVADLSARVAAERRRHTAELAPATPAAAAAAEEENEIAPAASEGAAVLDFETDAGRATETLDPAREGCD